MSQSEIFLSPLDTPTVRRLADDEFKDMIKFVVDIDNESMAAGGAMHADSEALLLDEGSKQSHLWGANYYPDVPADDRLEYTSMINIRPDDNNRGIEIESSNIRDRVKKIALHYFEGKP